MAHVCLGAAVLSESTVLNVASQPLQEIQLQKDDVAYGVQMKKKKKETKEFDAAEPNVER